MADEQELTEAQKQQAAVLQGAVEQINELITSIESVPYKRGQMVSVANAIARIEQARDILQGCIFNGEDLPTDGIQSIRVNRPAFRTAGMETSTLVQAPGLAIQGLPWDRTEGETEPDVTLDEYPDELSDRREPEEPF